MTKWHERGTKVKITLRYHIHNGPIVQQYRYENVCSANELIKIKNCKCSENYIFTRKNIGPTYGNA